ncbi:hypothetical protein [Actinomadura oligospora]|uniref:hypothetical protein n=1 Tax=Actinomadura oligospora TaxID=111804 RepID=UPI00047D4193|nr:hypothetical protein [Actinomadura oligospora]
MSVPEQFEQGFHRERVRRHEELRNALVQMAPELTCELRGGGDVIAVWDGRDPQRRRVLVMCTPVTHSREERWQYLWHGDAGGAWTAQEAARKIKEHFA